MLLVIKDSTFLLCMNKEREVIAIGIVFRIVYGVYFM